MKKTTTTKPASRTTTTQIVRIGGQRTRLTTRNGRVTAKPAGEEEWRLQAEAVRRLRAMPEYGHQFILAGDQNAARRGPKAQIQAKATGLEPGEPDMRIYGANGRLLLIEYKTDTGRLSPAQRQRHADLQRLGYTVEVIAAFTVDECAERSVAMVRAWLAGNSNTATSEIALAS